MLPASIVTISALLTAVPAIPVDSVMRDLQVIEAESYRGTVDALGEFPKLTKKKRVAVIDGFSLHADTAVHGNDRDGIERLCRYGARGPMAEARLKKLADGRYEYTPKKGNPFTVTAAALVKRLVALVPPARKHLTSFHGTYAPNSALRKVVMKKPLAPEIPVECGETKTPKKTRLLDWATLHKRTFGNDVLKCHCGGTRNVNAIHTTHKSAMNRLVELGIHVPSRVMPVETGPPQMMLVM